MLKKFMCFLLAAGLCLSAIPAQSHAIEAPKRGVVRQTEFTGTYVSNFDGYCVIEQDGGSCLLIDETGKLLRKTDEWMIPDRASGLYLHGDEGYCRLSDNTLVLTRAQIEASVKAFLQEHEPGAEIVSVETANMSGFRGGYATISFYVVFGPFGSRTLERVCALIGADGLVHYATPLVSFTSGGGYPIMWDLGVCSEGLVSYTQHYYDRDGMAQLYETGYMDTDGNRVLVYSGIDRPVEGAVVLPIIEGMYLNDFHNGAAVMMISGSQSTMIDRTGRQLFSPRSGAIFNDGGSYPIVFDRQSRWGYIDTAGQLVLEDFFEHAAGAYGLMFTVQYGGKWGVLRPDGSVFVPAVPLEFDAMSSPDEGVIYALAGGRVYIITFEDDDGSQTIWGRPKVSYLFKDVPEDAWYVHFLQYAYDNGIVGGVESADGLMYLPDGSLTHGQIMVMVANLHSLMKGDAYDFQAHRVAGAHWAKAFLDYCKAEGIIDGRFDNLLDAMVTREEMAYYFAHTLEPKYYVDVTDISFDDIADSPYRAEIMKLAKADIVGGKAYNHYDPKALVKRSEAAVFITNVLMAINAAAGNR